MIGWMEGKCFIWAFTLYIIIKLLHLIDEMASLAGRVSDHRPTAGHRHCGLDLYLYAYGAWVHSIISPIFVFVLGADHWTAG